MTLKRISIPSPNFSSRGGSTVRLIVLHTAEGARTIQSLGGFFANPSVQASSQAGADDTLNTIAQFVQDGDKAWAVAAYNPVSVNLEMCAFAAWTTGQWMQHPHMLANCAGWIAEEARRFGIPIVKLTDAEAQGGGRGVCQHSNLGVAGGGHHDCGPGFPIDLVLEMARNAGDPQHYGWFDTTVRHLGGGHHGSEVAIVKEYDRERAHWLRWPGRLRTLRSDMGFLAGRLQRLIQDDPAHPDADRRQWRHDQLAGRAEGHRYV